ncbi:pyrimidodiazepine synthase-like [Maniola jurtina]|uniref:pyrimidodiazepine synthase-like n=1 Tax=Maniola jurtina TaxID=191418 RepID=UPI001E68D5ED|nr:pyrimidodiazepine synthase-like [Maniola jurtina]XP_045782154.1 pyrimidodiazepine synthase-like [Maniola jurtina]
MAYYDYKVAGASLPPPLTDKLRLYHVEMNPYGHRVLLVLEAKRAKYEVYRLDPLNLPAWFRAKNPRLKIPVLEIPTDQGDKYLFESVVICDYLDEKYAANPLHSRDPYVKAQDRLLIERFNELIKGSLECFDTNFAFGSEQIIQTLDIFEKELASRGTYYFGGDRPGMLDYMIWPWVERLYLLRCVNEKKFDEKKTIFPNFADWGDQMQLDRVVKKHSSSPAEYFDYYKNARTHTMGYYL